VPGNEIKLLAGGQDHQQGRGGRHRKLHQGSEGPPLKDLPFWRSAIFNAKTIHVLKAVGEDLSNFENQTGLFVDGEKKLTDDQVATLRLEYSLKMKKLLAGRI